MKTLRFHNMFLAYKLKSLPGQNFCLKMYRILQYTSLSSLFCFFFSSFSCSVTEISISVTLTDTKLHSYTPFYNMMDFTEGFVHVLFIARIYS